MKIYIFVIDRIEPLSLGKIWSLPKRDDDRRVETKDPNEVQVLSIKWVEMFSKVVFFDRKPKLSCSARNSFLTTPNVSQIFKIFYQGSYLASICHNLYRQYL